jgi:hypothetical protein
MGIKPFGARQCYGSRTERLQLLRAELEHRGALDIVEHREAG